MIHNFNIYIASKKKELIRFSLLSLIFFSLDMITKYFFYNLESLNSLEIIKPIVNTGISFGFKVPLIFVIFISIVALILFLWLFKKKTITLLMASLLIAGTFGNLIDRIIYGGVRDFISIGNFPIFNVADSLLNIGILLFFVQEFFSSKDNKKNI